MSTITVTGWAGNTPAVVVTPTGRRHATVRVASTHRYRNDRQEWVDGDTQWYAARFWDDVAENVAASVRRGDPVVLSGRLVLEQWDGEDGPRAGLGVRSATIGHDLSRGRAQFTRYVRESVAPGGAAAPEGASGAGDDPWAVAPGDGVGPAGGDLLPAASSGADGESSASTSGADGADGADADADAAAEPDDRGAEEGAARATGRGARGRVNA